MEQTQIKQMEIRQHLKLLFPTRVVGDFGHNIARKQMYGIQFGSPIHKSDLELLNLTSFEVEYIQTSDDVLQLVVSYRKEVVKQ